MDPEALQQTVQGLFERFDVRMENLHWRETQDGVLLIAESSAPETVTCVQLSGDEIETVEVGAAEAGWHSAVELESPETPDTSPQFD